MNRWRQDIEEIVFCVGAPWDMVSRNFSATLINEALGLNLKQTDVITVSSMEDEAVAQVVGRWNAMSSTKQVKPPAGLLVLF